MQDKICFTVPGKPKGKDRPRFNTKTKHTYKTSSTRAYENDVKRVAKKFFDNEHAETEKPVKVEIKAFYAIPKSTSKKMREAMLDKKIIPTIKPDCDNIAKVILDSINGIAYKDDKQVADLKVEKFYSDVPRVEVSIYYGGE